MAGNLIPGLPAPNDGDAIIRRLEALEAWKQSFPQSVAQTTQEIVTTGTFNAISSISILIGVPPFPGALTGFFGDGSILPDSAYNIVVTGEITWAHAMPATGAGTFTASLTWAHQLGVLGGTAVQPFTGTITSGKINKLRFPFAFRADAPSDLDDLQITLQLAFSGATFNPADSDTSACVATFVYART